MEQRGKKRKSGPGASQETKASGQSAVQAQGPYAGWARKQSKSKNQGRFYLVSPSGDKKVWEDQVQTQTTADHNWLPWLLLTTTDCY